MGATIAITGTPGTGKSAVGARLKRRSRVAEVGALALQTRTGRRRSGVVGVDLPRLSKAFRELPARRRPEYVVGHLSHLLPVRDVVVLRCHPVRLYTRLNRARRGSSHERAENVVAEATDLILREALDLRRRVLEIDTTRLRPTTIARTIERWAAGRRKGSLAGVGWLKDPAVTEFLLEHAP